MKTSPQENFRTLNLVLLICNSFNQLVSERQNLSGILITPQCRYWTICIRQKLGCLLILSKAYSKYDIKRISQSIFFQPFAIMFLFQHAYSGQIFPFNSPPVELSHPWAAPRTAEGCWWKPPLSRGKSNRALRAELRPDPRDPSDLGVFAEHKDHQSHHQGHAQKELPHLQGAPLPCFTYCPFSSSSLLHCLISSGS